ncbi:MAG: single-stranded DNA-binding protein [Aggregatilineales bacterium]
MSYQQLTIVGYIGADAEIRYLTDGTAVTNFSVAVNKSVRNAQGDRTQKTTWFNVALWGERAETLVSYLKKGTLLLVTGEVSADAYSDKQTGKPLGSLKLVAGRVQLLSPKPEEEPPNEDADHEASE